jgi:hypothetical protein
MSLFMFILHLFLCLFLGSLEVIQDDEVVAILGEQRKAKKIEFVPNIHVKLCLKLYLQKKCSSMFSSFINLSRKNPCLPSLTIHIKT